MRSAAGAPRSAPCRSAAAGGPAWPAAGAPARSPQEAVELRRRDAVRMRSPSASASFSTGGRCGRSSRWRSAPSGAGAACGATRARSWSRSLLGQRGEVPLVEHERRGAARLHRQLGDAQVLRGDAVARRRRRRARRRRARPPAASAAPCSTRRTRRPWPGGACRRCRRATSWRPSTSSGGSIASRVVPATSETITRSAPSELVDERGLADVRAPDHREAQESRRPPRRLALGQQLDERSSRSPVPRPCAAETGDRLAEPEAVELGGQRHVARRRRPCWPR